MKKTNVNPLKGNEMIQEQLAAGTSSRRNTIIIDGKEVNLLEYLYIKRLVGDASQD
jgi:hypothetical protein